MLFTSKTSIYINKGLNSVANNVNKGINNFTNNLNNSNNNNSKTMNNNITSLLPFKSNNTNVKNVTSNNNVTNVKKNEWVLPLLVFIIVATVFIVIFVRFQDKISAGINNIIQN